MATEQKQLTAKELMGQSIEELTSTEHGLSEEIFRHRVKRSMGQLENTMAIRFARRNLARVKTVIAAKAKATQVAPQAEAPQAKTAPAKTAQAKATPAKTKSKE